MILRDGVACLLIILYLFSHLYLLCFRDFLSLLNLLRPDKLAPVRVELDGVDHLRYAIQQRTPAENQHGDACGIHRTDNHVEACEQDDRGEYPVSEADFSELTGIRQAHILVDGTQDEHAADDIHQCCDEDVGCQSEDGAEDDASHTDDGEGGGLAGYDVTIGIGNLIF